MRFDFSTIIQDILQKSYGDEATSLFEKSLLLQYLNLKTRSANKDSKSRSSFANLYAIYVIVEDYIYHGFDKKGNYAGYEGALYKDLIERQQNLPFGKTLQNHALNNRMNAEFQKFFPTAPYIPILRNLETKRYWFNENLLKITLKDKEINIAYTIIEVINAYIKAKQYSFKVFFEALEELQTNNSAIEDKKAFVKSLLIRSTDARLFEIVSYAILKYYYSNQTIFWGYTKENLTEDTLKLYKTGKTNANDGGIDFVMRPLGRFFQVTESLDFKKYFLDIDKIQKYPISFVIKSDEPIETITKKIRENAKKAFAIESIIEKYMSCIEEIINIPMLTIFFDEIVEKELFNDLLYEICKQSKYEFNYIENITNDYGIIS